MKKRISILGSFVLVGALSFAQATGSQSSQSSDMQGGAKAGQTENRSPLIETHEFTGCLNKAAENYVVIADDGQTYKLNPAEPKNGLDQYIGKKIAVTAKDNTSPVLNTSVAQTPAEIAVEVEAVRLVSGNCKGQESSTKSADASGSSASESSSAQSQSAAQPVETPTGQQPSNAGSMAAGTSTDATSPRADAGQAASGAAGQAERSAESAAGTVERGAERTGEAVAEGAQSAGETIASGAQSAGRTIERGAERTGEAVSSGAERAAGTADRSAEQVGVGDRDTSSSAAAAPERERTLAQAGQTPAERDQEAMLPQTATPLPLIALLGLGSIVGGIASRRRKNRR
jgi:hypothetical protein